MGQDQDHQPDDMAELHPADAVAVPGSGLGPYCLCGADGHSGGDDGAERRQLYAEEQRALQRPVRVELQYKE